MRRRAPAPRFIAPDPAAALEGVRRPRKTDAEPVWRIPFDTKLTNDPNPNVVVKPMSNYEGHKRLEENLEKDRQKRAGGRQVCDVCHRRAGSWRIVPCVDGHKLKPTAAGFRGKFLVCCDDGPEGCAATLERAGVARQAVATQARIEALGLEVP